MRRVAFAGDRRFGEVEAVKDFTLDVADREFLVLLGPSGCGSPRRCAWSRGSRSLRRARSRSATGS